MYARNRILNAVVSGVLLSISGCGGDARNAAIADAAKKWLNEVTVHVEPEKAGTVTPAHTITLKNGRTLNLPRHVQTKKEEADQVEDARWAAHFRSMVRGFTAEGSTLLALTTLTPAETKEAQELCHDLGGFIWAKDNRHFGLDSITVMGAHNERLSYRIGLKGDVR
jgi:hypothetical protein